MFKIFYSWQSDLPGRTNRRLILSALERACGELKTEGGIVVEPVVDRDTLGVSGAPDIRETILEKIEQADAFVADVSLLNIVTASTAIALDALDNGTPTRLTPNPNVLTELGYALAHMGTESLVLVANTYFGPLEDLPFDLRPLRKLAYRADPAADLSAVKKELVNDFKLAVRDIGHVVRNDPVLAIVVPKTRNVVGQAEGLLRDLIKAASKPYDERTIDAERLLDVCQHVNPQAPAPLITGRDAAGNFTYATWLDYLRHYRHRSSKFTTEILQLLPFLKKEHLALLATVEQCFYFQHLDSFPNLPYRNTNLEWLARNIWEYVLATRRLSEYTEKALVRRSTTF